MSTSKPSNSIITFHFLNTDKLILPKINARHTPSQFPQLVARSFPARFAAVFLRAQSPSSDADDPFLLARQAWRDAGALLLAAKLSKLVKYVSGH